MYSDGFQSHCFPDSYAATRAVIPPRACRCVSTPSFPEGFETFRCIACILRTTANHLQQRPQAYEIEGLYLEHLSQSCYASIRSESCFFSKQSLRRRSRSFAGRWPIESRGDGSWSRQDDAALDALQNRCSITSTAQHRRR